ncbi:MAG: alpha/beta hydrolase [Saprospiraceae bacterium]|jgi:esterase/lipase|nr:alpha/beta hydrolase [Saprospiraceae bacterium]
MNALKISLLLVAALGIVIISGPRVKFDKPVFNESALNLKITELENYILVNESNVKSLKPDNQARIVWADEKLKQKTEYAVVYLHGFSASQKEGDPVHLDFAKRYGFNLYLSRLEDHGSADSNLFINLTPDNFLRSAKEAIQIGKTLGDKVIVMSCSTGGTLSVILAAAGENIHSMIMYSPNIEIYDKTSELLLYPWGRQITDLVMGGTYNKINYDSIPKKYWNSVYHTNGLFVIKSMIHDYMTEENFKKIKIPVFLGYYYKDEEHQDKVVSVNRMLDFYDQISTPDSLKQKTAFPEASAHVISSGLFSHDIEGVEKATFQWAEKILKIMPKVNNN